MSKRSGEFVTLRDLYEEVGVDAARYFFLMRKGASPLDFDLDLAKRQTDENPVFYVQMAHARLSGIFRTAERAPESVTGALELAALPAPQDAELLKKMVTFPEIVEKAARDREPHRDHRLPPRATPPRSTPGITTRGRSARPKARPPSRRACCSPAPPVSSWPMPSPSWASPLPTGCDRMTLLVVGSVALDSIFTPFRRDRRRAGWLRRVLQRGRIAAASGAGRRCRRQRLSGGRARAARRSRHRLERRGARRRREFPLEGQVLLRPPEPGDARDPARRVRRLPAQAARGLSVGGVSVPRQHRSRAPARGAEPGAQAQARRVRHDELLDPEQEARSSSTC